MSLPAMNAQATQISKTARWHEELNPDGINGKYDSKYSLAKCVIWILKDHRGIIISAEIPDSNPLWTVHQTVEITRTGNGVQVIRFPYWRTRGMAEGVVKGDYDDIFARYYVGATKNLPPDVRKLFWGEYDIGDKP